MGSAGSFSPQIGGAGFRFRETTGLYKREPAVVTVALPKADQRMLSWVPRSRPPLRCYETPLSTVTLLRNSVSMTA